MKTRIGIIDHILVLYRQGLTHETIANKLKVSPQRVDKTINGILRKSKKENKPITKKNIPSKSYENLPCGSIFKNHGVHIQIVPRTSCKHCLVNIDHSKSHLCNDSCEPEMRLDGMTVMFMLAVIDDELS